MSIDWISFETHSESVCRCGHPYSHHYYDLIKRDYEGICGGFDCQCPGFKYLDWLSEFTVIPESIRAGRFHNH